MSRRRAAWRICQLGSLFLGLLLVRAASASDYVYYDAEAVDAMSSASRTRIYTDASDVYSDDHGDNSTCVSGSNSCECGSCSSDGCGDGGGCSDGRCGGRGCKLCRRQGPAAQESWFNCGCNGSYKYPVPPLYTYMWPGLYSQQLVTNYHSPWRFPPLKPYTPEVPTGEPFRSAGTMGQSAVRQAVDYDLAPPVPQTSAPESGRGVELTSQRLRRLYGSK